MDDAKADFDKIAELDTDPVDADSRRPSLSWT